VGVLLSKKKSGKQPINHDASVRAIAEEMKRDNWEVKANLDGFEKPSKIGDFLPDVEGQKKGCMSRICEVVTEDMFAGDKKRYIDVKNYCDEYDFHMYVIDKDGKRKEIDPRTLGKK